MEYSHTQHGPLHYLLDGIAGIFLVGAVVFRELAGLSIPLGCSACLVALFAISFRKLTVSDAGEHLSIQFGPLPLFRKSIAYKNITSVEPGTTALIDGWGVHYIPGRGETWNLWGRDCAVVHLDGRIIRVGTDDRENLVAFLQQRILEERAEELGEG